MASPSSTAAAKPRCGILKYIVGMEFQPLLLIPGFGNQNDSPAPFRAPDRKVALKELSWRGSGRTGGGTGVMRGFEIRWGLQTGDAQDRGQRRFGRGLQERQGARVADQAAMILRLMLCVGGSKRRGLAGGDGAEQEQRERVLDPGACPPRHG